MIRAQGHLKKIELVGPIKMDETLPIKLEPPRFLSSVEDTALVLDVLAERSEHTATQYSAELAKDKKLCLDVGNNFGADREVSGAFERAVETVRGLGFETGCFQ